MKPHHDAQTPLGPIRPQACPIPLPEAMALWLQYGMQIFTSCLDEHGVPAFDPDEAMLLAAKMAGFGMSEATVKMFETAYRDPDQASITLQQMTDRVIDRVATAQANAARSSASIFAKEFGVVGAGV